MAKETKNIRISAEAHFWVARVCGVTRESLAEYASRILLAATRADWRRLLAELAAEEQDRGPPPGPEPGPEPPPRRKK